MKLELVIPTSLSEIPLMHYQKFMIVASNKDNSDVFISQKMIEIFCGIELKQVVNIKLNDVIELTTHFNKLFSEKKELKRTFEIQGVKFGFTNNLEDISFGEYIDLESNIVDVQSFHKAMAVMYRPIVEEKGNKYTIEKYTADTNYSELMKYAPLDVALPASVFFWTLGNELLTATLSYLENKMTRKQKTILAKQLNLENNGDGINQYISSLKETLQSLKVLQNSDFLSA
ncbi:hypothetical protein UFOVP207_52 [uncultured Caudovirales phage]|uniref:Uncharacterized protein n=1 Tax=uncultured Caudovirales phage TaxID=2100421 RepID=A0A6J7WPE5_9CAUD|nr:hypothetical protein UFOVP207_52 [uncultured Caudovirales phage]